MRTKRIIIALLCVLALMLGACSKADNKIENQHGEEFTVSDEAVQVGTEGGEYEPYTITLNLERSGIGQNMEETFTSAPVHAIASGDQMADFFFDLGLEDHMAGYTRGSCWSTVSGLGFPVLRQELLRPVLPGSRHHPVLPVLLLRLRDLRRHL